MPGLRIEVPDVNINLVVPLRRDPEFGKGLLAPEVEGKTGRFPNAFVGPGRIQSLVTTGILVNQFSLLGFVHGYDDVGYRDLASDGRGGNRRWSFADTPNFKAYPALESLAVKRSL